MEGIRILRITNPVELFKEICERLVEKVQNDGVLSIDEVVDVIVVLLYKIEDIPSWLAMSAQLASFVIKGRLFDLNIEWETRLTQEEIERISRTIVQFLQLIRFDEWFTLSEMPNN